MRPARGGPDRAAASPATRPRRSRPSTGSIYAGLADASTARTPRGATAAANEAALDWIADRVAARRHRLRLPPPRVLRLRHRARTAREQLEAEAHAALRGRAAAPLVVDDTPLPYPVAGACASTTRRSSTPRSTCSRSPSSSRGGGTVYEHTRAVAGRRRRALTVKTPGGRLTADHVDRRHPLPVPRPLARVRARDAERSYAIACRIAGAPPAGMFISGDCPPARSAPSRSTARSCCWSAARATAPATGGDTERALRAARGVRPRALGRAVGRAPLVLAGRDDRSTGCRSSAALTPRSERLLMATGFAKWGMTSGTAAASCSPTSSGPREPGSAGLFDPIRLNVRASAGRGP